MRRFLTVLICLSTLAMAQNVIAAAPDSSSVSGIEALAAVDYAEASQTGSEAADGLALSPAAPGRDVPTPGTMMLLVAGLSGLVVVGARTGERPGKRSS